MSLEELDRARAIIALNEGLISYLLYRIRVEESNIGTLRTDGERIEIDPEYWNTLDIKHKVGTLVHEICHVVFEHQYAITLVSEPYVPLMNLVGDVVINKILLRNGYELPKGAMISFSMLGYPELDNEDVTEKTTIWFYEQILKKMPKIRIRCGYGDSGTDKQEQNSNDIEIEINGKTFRMKPCVKGNSKNKDVIKGIIENASRISQLGAGRVSGQLVSYIERFYKTETDWRSILKRYMQILTEEEYTYTKPKQIGRVLRPRLKPLYEGGLNIILIIDSSGSISDDTLSKFACEIYTLMREFAQQIYLIVNDADIQLEKSIRCITDIPKKYSGRGGTVFGKAFERLQQPIQIEEPVVVVLTDGDIADLDELKQPPYKVIWMITSSNKKFKPPFGSMVSLSYN